MAHLFRVLSIDDSLFVQKAIKEALSSSYELFFEYSGEAALEFLSENDADIIILDVNMAGIDGFETMRRIKQSGNSAPVIFLTSEPREIGEKQALLLGASGYVTKPFSSQELKRLIDSYFSV